MRRAVLDSNAIDSLADTPGAYEIVRAAIDAGSLELLFTHVNVDEISRIRDEDRRAWLLLLLIDLGRLVATGGMVIDYSRLNFCRILSDVDAEATEALRSGNIRHTRDALIAGTARFEQCGLVTNDDRLTARARDQGIDVITTWGLLNELGFQP